MESEASALRGRTVRDCQYCVMNTSAYLELHRPGSPNTGGGPGTACGLWRRRALQLRSTIASTLSKAPCLASYRSLGDIGTDGKVLDRSRPVLEHPDP